MGIEERLNKIENLLQTLIKQDQEKTAKLSKVFEALDGRLTTIENGIVAAAGDASQARHNTHQIRNAMQSIASTQVVILEKLGIDYEEPIVNVPTLPPSHENG
jgi:Zn-dependent M32 family carboxypeptidase